MAFTNKGSVLVAALLMLGLSLFLSSDLSPPRERLPHFRCRPWSGGGAPGPSRLSDDAIPPLVEAVPAV